MKYTILARDLKQVKHFGKFTTINQAVPLINDLPLLSIETRNKVEKKYVETIFLEN